MSIVHGVSCQIDGSGITGQGNISVSGIDLICGRNCNTAIDHKARKQLFGLAPSTKLLNSAHEHLTTINLGAHHGAAFHASRV